MESFRTHIPTPFSLPQRINRLGELAYNLWWTWHPEAQRLFSRIDSQLWEETSHNPVLFLRRVDRARLNTVTNNRYYLDFYDRTFRAYDQYMTTDDTWFMRTYPELRHRPIAYFSMEFGLHETLPIYAGGLGILSGDHTKEASDLGLPFVGIGFFYTEGYFTQYITEDGWQEARYTTHQLDTLPVLPVLDEDGLPVTISVELPDRDVHAGLWEVHVGRVPLYLLDTNIEQNTPADRALSSRLYGSNQDLRICQEILLGIGGVRALRVLGYNPSVWHMNEGHAAFLVLERIRELLEADHSFEEAADIVRETNIFTTHTPVPAGNDEFPLWLIDKYLARIWSQLNLTREQFVDLARNTVSWGDTFSMPVLALRYSKGRNGVSELHGQVARQMWHYLWPDKKVEDVPITHVTNGIHTGTWIARRLLNLYDRYLGPDWSNHPGDAALWRRADTIPAEELWRTHERRRERLVAFARRRLREQLERRGGSQSELDAADEVLDPEALTIGFARRFATYKRATLLLRDAERLTRLLNDPQRPVQIIYAGKAHPRDDEGKRLIQQIVNLARRPEIRRRIVFLEDYDMAVSRCLVQGCDVWLNTPLRPMEASGTSGMKAAANGALNVSTLDGWWDEAWRESDSALIGWAIGNGEHNPDRDYQDQLDAEALYHLLENDVVQAFYERGRDHLPRRWIARMKVSLSRLCREYNTHRMVQQYACQFYMMAHARYNELQADGAARIRALAAWLSRARAAWPQVRIEAVDNGQSPQINVNEALRVRARVRLGALTPDDVSVELYMGPLNAAGELVKPVATAMQSTGQDPGGVWAFEGAGSSCAASGQWGFTVRVVPYHPDLAGSYPPGLIAWADGTKGAVA